MPPLKTELIMFSLKKTVLLALCLALFSLTACGEEAATPSGKWVISKEETKKTPTFSAMPDDAVEATFNLLTDMTLDIDMDAKFMTITVRDKSESGNFDIISQEKNTYTLSDKTGTASVTLLGNDLLEFKSEGEALIFKRVK